MASLPPLRRIHADQIYNLRRYRRSIEYWQSRSTAEIVSSLRPRPADPSYQEYLKVRADGVIFQGNTRVFVLESRGYDIESLQRYPLDR